MCHVSAGNVSASVHWLSFHSPGAVILYHHHSADSLSARPQWWIYEATETSLWCVTHFTIWHNGINWISFVPIKRLSRYMLQQSGIRVRGRGREKGFTARLAIKGWSCQQGRAQRSRAVWRQEPGIRLA